MIRAKLVVTIVLLSSSLARADVAVDHCGQVIPAEEVGYLTADLDCTTGGPGICAYDYGPCNKHSDCAGAQACTHAAIALSKRATLRLDGHTFTGPQVVDYPFGVYCAKGRCSIEGPGTIIGGTGSAIYVLPNWRAKLSVRDVDLRGNGVSGFGIDAINSRVTLTDVTATGFSQAGIYTKRLEATNVVASNNFLGLVGTVRVRGTNLTAKDNANRGVYAGKFVIDGLTSTGNKSAGLYATSGGVLANGTVVNNTWKGVGMDIISFRRPTLIQVTCDWSGRRPESVFVDEVLGPGGVCALS